MTSLKKKLDEVDFEANIQNIVKSIGTIILATLEIDKKMVKN